MDNFRFRAEAVSVPEPEPCTLLPAGLGLVGRVAGRHLRSQA